MLKRILGSTHYTADNVVRQTLRSHDAYQKVRWNNLEKVIVFCSTHYIKSIGFLFLGITLLFTLLYCLKPVIIPLAVQYTPAWKTLFDWQTTLLGGQLTIIGIVYPLVVGLVSVIFQKKSTRKIVQAAYQRYSGFMFAGLSGLFLSAFILAGSLLRTFSSNYSYALLCGIATLWMLLNIGLSVWFFIQSLNVLDDARRERMVFRYLVSDAFMPVIREKIRHGFLHQPVRYRILDTRVFRAIRLHDYDFESGYHFLTKKKEGNQQLLDIWYRPLTLYLKYLDRRLTAKNQQISLAFITPYDRFSGHDELPLINVKGGAIGGIHLKLLRTCFRVGTHHYTPVNQKSLVKGISGDIYDALNEGDINAVEDAVQNMCLAFSSILNIFQYSSRQGSNNLLLLKNDEAFEDSFVEKFYAEMYLLFRQAMLKTDVSDRFFARCMHIPQTIYGMRDGMTSQELRVGLMYTYYARETLMDWGRTNHLRMTLGQRQSYEGLVIKFVELWESWPGVIEYKHKRRPDARLFQDALRKHLLILPHIVVSALRSGDAFATDWAIDLLHRWTHCALGAGDEDARLTSRPFFRPPADLTSPTFSAEAYRNALVDVRLCTAAFLIHQATEEPTLTAGSVVETILSGKLMKSTGAFETGSPVIISGQQVIDIYLRTHLWGCNHTSQEPGWLEGLIGELSAANGEPMISGRVYMGNRITDVSDLIPAYVQLGIMLSGSDYPVSPAMMQALESGQFDYRGKERIAGILTTLQEQAAQQTAFLVTPRDDFAVCRTRFQQTLEAYQRAITQRQHQDIAQAEIDEARLADLSRKASDILRKKVGTQFPFTLFKDVRFSPKTPAFIKKTIISHTDKQFYAKGIKTSPIHHEGASWAENAVRGMRDTLLFEQLRNTAECSVPVASFSDIVTFMRDNESLSTENILLVSGRAFFDEYQTWANQPPAASKGMLSVDNAGDKYLKTARGTCRLFFTPWIPVQRAILVGSTYFERFSVAESATGEIVILNAEPVPSRPDRICVHITYSVEECYHGAVRVGFQRSEN